MEILGNILVAINKTMTVPTPFGWFHILSWIISIALGVVLCITIKNPDEKIVRRVLFTMGLICIILEIYKQIVFNISYADGVFTYGYQWYAFPFQFCSMPMYVQLLAIFFKKGKVHNALCAFLATYAVFAGVCVMVYPIAVFIGTIGVNIQTMVCHGSMISIGIFLYGSGYVKPELKTALRAFPVYTIAVGLAVIMNEAMVASGILGDHTFNMFYISRHFEPSLPVYSTVQNHVPYPWCLIIYVLTFTVAAFAITMIVKGIKKLCEIGKKKLHKA